MYIRTSIKFYIYDARGNVERLFTSIIYEMLLPIHVQHIKWDAINYIQEYQSFYMCCLCAGPYIKAVLAALVILLYIRTSHLHLYK